jgi:nucleoid DNA-binding protein
MSGNKINLHQLGILDIKTQKARMVRNPKTGETFEKAEYKKMSFRATKVMKTRLQ